MYRLAVRRHHHRFANPDVSPGNTVNCQLEILISTTNFNQQQRSDSNLE